MLEDLVIIPTDKRLEELKAEQEDQLRGALAEGLDFYDLYPETDCD